MHVRHHGTEIFADSHKKGLFRTTFRMCNMHDNKDKLHDLKMDDKKDDIILAWHKKMDHLHHGAMHNMVKNKMAHGIHQVPM